MADLRLRDAIISLKAGLAVNAGGDTLAEEIFVYDGLIGFESEFVCN